MNPSLARTFADDLFAWFESGDNARLVRAFRSPCSGVPHDVAAAYAVVAQHEPLLDAISRLRIAVSATEREALLRFSERVRSIAPQTDIFDLFELQLEPAVASDEPEVAGDFRLAEARTAQAPSSVRARKAHFSASALNAYAECPRKWYFRYVCAAIEDKSSSASTYGTAFHAALEDFHGEFPEPSPALEAEMRTKIVGYVNWAFERFRNEFDTSVEVELQKRRAQRTAQRYIDWLVAESARAPFTVIGREIGANLELDGFDFVGYIDRLDRDNRTGEVAIIDYKTGSIATTPAEYREKVRTFRDFQLPFYYWARTAAGDTVSRLALIPLKDALVDVAPVSVEVGKTITIGELESARARMIEICTQLTSGELTAFPVARDPSACTYCSYANACADRPHEERERFGR